jgi:hypothetical protein
LSPASLLRILQTRPALTRLLCRGNVNGDGWHSYHRLADVHPQHFSTLISSLDAATAAQVLSVRKGDGGMAVARMFSKHAATHGKVFEGVIAGLDTTAAFNIMRLSNDSGTLELTAVCTLLWRQHPRLCNMTVLGLLVILAWYFLPSLPLFLGHSVHSPQIIIHDDVSASEVCAIEIK